MIQTRWVVTALTTLAALALPGYAFGQPSSIAHYTLTSWNERNGLSSGAIRSLVQDRDGYLWLGSAAGLLRFDGVRFVRVEVRRSPQLPFAEIGALAASRDGSLWIGFVGAGGVSRLQRGGTIRSFSQTDGLLDAAVTVLREDSSGTMWAGTRLGLSRFSGDRWEAVDAAAGLPPQAILDLVGDKAGNLWVAAAGGAFVRRSGEARFERLAWPAQARALAEDASGALWISSANDNVTAKVWEAATPVDASRIQPISNRMAVSGTNLLIDRRGTMWLGDLDGVIRVSDPQLAAPVIERLSEAKGLTSSTVRALMQDREGNVWIGTLNGLNRLSDATARSLFLDDGSPSGGLMRAVIAGPDGSIWTGGQSGLYRIQGETHTHFDERDGLPSRAVSALSIDREGALWVGTSNGLARQVGTRFERIRLDNVPLNVIRAIGHDGDGSIWLTDTQHGVVRLTPTGPNTYAPLFTHPNIGMSIVADRRDRIWIGFANGGVGISEAGRFRLIPLMDKPVGDRVGAILEDHAGRIWVGTNGALTRLEGTHVSTLLTGGEIPLDRITAVLEDDGGTLWLGTGAGIVRLTPGEFDRAVADASYRPHYGLHDASDGLAGTPSWLGYPSAARAKDGQLWFITSAGISIVDPRQAVVRPAPPAPRIEEAVIDGRIMEPSDGLQFPAGTSRLQVNYTSLALGQASKIHFRYRLDGIDSDWVDAGIRRQAFYTNLGPGNYVFRVGVTDGGGGQAWSDIATPWTFSVKPRIYQTYWFDAAVALAIGGAVFQINRLRTRRLRAAFTAVLNERTRMGREIHDTLLQGLVGVALQLDKLASQIQESPQNAIAHVDRLRGQVESYIRETRQSIWVLRSPSLGADGLAPALRRLELHIGDGVRFEFSSTGEPRPLAPNTEEQLLRIAQEAITNAVRHGKPSAVRVELAYSDTSAVLRVIDDGIGFEPEATDYVTAGHWGLLGMRERAQQAKGSCRIMARSGYGTEVEVVVPVPLPS